MFALEPAIGVATGGYSRRSRALSFHPGTASCQYGKETERRENMADVLKPRWGQPATGIISTIAFFLIAWLTWYLFSDPRGPVGSFPYPFVLYLAMMILVGLW